MRGFPFFNLIICLFLSGGVLLPLVYRATQTKAPVVTAAVPVKASVAGTVPAHVSLRFATAPVSARLKDGDKVLHEWKPDKPATELEEDISLPISQGRSEFTVQIEWPAGTPMTVGVLRVEPDGLPFRKADIWGSGSADEVIALIWKEDAP